jgi:DNA-binding protein Fis
MERLALLGPWDQVDVSDLSFIEDSTLANGSSTYVKPILGRDNFDLPNERLDLEKLNEQILKRAFEKNMRNQTLTARYFGISRRVLQGRLKKLGLI